MTKDPWADVRQTFASAREDIRKAQDEVLTEHRRQTELDAATTTPSYGPAFDRIMADRVASGGAA